MKLFMQLILVGACMSANPIVTTTNFPASGMQLLSGSSAEFTAALTATVGLSAASTITPVAPYSVIFKNTGDSIKAITVRWTVFDGSKQLIPMTSMYKIDGGECRTGQMILMTPVSGLSLFMDPQQTPKLQNPDRLVGVIAKVVEQYHQFSQVIISLDSVVYADDTFAGPDGAKHFDQLNRQRAHTLQIASDLLNRTPEQRQAYLQTLLNAPEPPDPDPNVEDSDYNQVRNLAGMYNGLLNGGFSEDVIVESLKRQISESVQLRKRTL